MLKLLNIHLYILLISIIVIVFLQITILFILCQRKTPKIYIEKNNEGSCSLNTCGAIDPVNEPDYNMRNIIKQSILLEEHIAEKNKYCISCIIKHFLHIIGLSEEAVWLAGKNINNYPLLKESSEFYQHIFDKWLQNKHDELIKKETLDVIRERRRKLIEIYYI